MSIFKGTLLPNVLLSLGIIFIGYLTYIHLNRPDFRQEIKMLWQVQEITNSDKPEASSLSDFVNIDSYLKNLNEAFNDPSINLVNNALVNDTFSDTTLTTSQKANSILRADLNKVIKMNYGKFKGDQVDKATFELQLRDVCTGDFKLEMEVVNKKIEKLLLFKL